MSRINQNIFSNIKKQKSLAILIDPDKFDSSSVSQIVKMLPKETNFILVGGSTVDDGDAENCVRALKKAADLPIVLFPGSYRQITNHADALFFMSLLSGDNSEYLIHQQRKSIDRILASKLEIIPTAYILIDGGKLTSVERISQTNAIPQDDLKYILDTVMAGEFMGKSCVYLEAGSGAEFPVSTEIVKAVKALSSMVVIVGGGIRTQKQQQELYEAGADVIVIGTAFEQKINK
ncbi:MAG: geranylgeranylglyceryl/heptaprenylglyceryl phosphate synthase [Psychroflexus halocasei]|uniref:geranylgeranylglyceryl/heptaprenylglyceryl phosphate synthase n=1 Tax=Psychroflexus sp. S27 TaxID=1982757 RepID=UPI000C2A4CF4|nr:geranylgeranylglyceryl/heptaprenylglyceryl phosphate synthase [Psychroflexus sp. S27]PJX20150.1 geranylgeranylglyceryl/heptaprenylglyceryl phosphate synthase [Psychroflexus sp. S27]